MQLKQLLTMSISVVLPTSIKRLTTQRLIPSRSEDAHHTQNPFAVLVGAPAVVNGLSSDASVLLATSIASLTDAGTLYNPIHTGTGTLYNSGVTGGEHRSGVRGGGDCCYKEGVFSRGAEQLGGERHTFSTGQPSQYFKRFVDNLVSSIVCTGGDKDCTGAGRRLLDFLLPVLNVPLGLQICTDLMAALHDELQANSDYNGACSISRIAVFLSLLFNERHRTRHVCAGGTDAQTKLKMRILYDSLFALPVCRWIQQIVDNPYCRPVAALLNSIVCTVVPKSVWDRRII
eukprot:Lankesteria_metandrocarpae@DN524_c0_g1_i1.p1